MITESIVAIGVVAGASFLRNLAGWIENAFKDGVVSKYEWGLLGATFLRTGTMALAIYYGFDMGALDSIVLAPAIEIVLNKLKRD